jgi:hypothetical protein
MFLTEFVGVLMIGLNAEFHMPVCSDSLVINIRWEAKYSVLAGVMLLFYILQKNCLNKSCIFFEDLLSPKFS